MLDSTGEDWRDVIGYEGLYSVSSLGRVRSESQRQGAVPGRILKSGNSGDYPRVSLHRGDGGETKLVHRLVLEAFVGPCPEGMEGCHYDGDKSNVSLANLRWDTSSSNNEDFIRLGRSRQANQVNCKRGHPLSDPNVYRRGRQRACKSCSWEFSHARRENREFDIARSNANLVRIMARHAERELREAEKGD